MNLPALYSEYTWSGAVGMFGGVESARVQCERQWVLFPHVAICFATLADEPGNSYFRTPADFNWVNQKPYEIVTGLAHAQDSLPQQVWGGRNDEPPVHLFARTSQQDRYLYLGQLDHSFKRARASRGRFGTTHFRLTPALADDVWNEFGRFAPGNRNHAAIDAALRLLDGPTSIAERLEILHVVAEHLHGLITDKDGLSDAEISRSDLPGPLRWWFKLAGRCRIIGLQNNLVPPSAMRIKDGKLVFYAECQWCYQWGTDSTGDDPPVYGRERDDDPWQSENMLLSEFLITACLCDAIICDSPFGAWNVKADEAALVAIAKHLHPLPIAPWGWMGNRFWAGNGAFAITNECDGIYLGAKSKKSLEFIKPFVGADWDLRAL